MLREEPWPPCPPSVPTPIGWLLSGGKERLLGSGWLLSGGLLGPGWLLSGGKECLLGPGWLLSGRLLGPGWL